MLDHTVFKFVALATCTALVGAALEANPVQAAIITTDFDFVITEGPLTGEGGGGSFTYDDSFLTGTGVEELSIDLGSFIPLPPGLLSLDFAFLGFTANQNNFITTGGGPVLGFLDGEFQSLRFGTRFTRYRFGTETMEFAASPSAVIPGCPDDRDCINTGPVTYRQQPVQDVPEPATMLGLSGVGLALLLRKKQLDSQDA